jgi:hypothetical protein
MPVTLLKTQDTDAVLHFPLAGLNVVSAFAKQPNMPIDQNIGWYARTTPYALNVRAYDVFAGKARGGSRPGLGKYVAQRLPGSVMNLNSVVGVGYDDPGGSMQTSSSGRLVTLVAVANGDIRIASAGSDSWVVPTNGNGALNASGVVFSAQNGPYLFFADGVHSKYYSPADNTVHDWVNTAGERPTDEDGNKSRLITTWQGCIVEAGLRKDSQNWFLTAVGNPFDNDYAPLSSTPTQAVAGNNSSLGKIGDVITSLMAFSDDVLIFGGDHSMWAMQGHPANGGQIIRISDAIGTAWGAPWCTDPYGNLYFFSNRCGIYRIDPTAARPQPVRISQPIEPLLATVNTGANTISMAWSDARQGIHLFVTRTSGPFQATHLFYESRTNAWIMDRFANKMHNPLCCTSFDGNNASDRVVLIGSWDGFVRYLNPDATDDDGVAIQSAVIIGPLLTENMDEIMAMEMQGVFAEEGGSVTWEAFVGKTAEKALSSPAVLSGTWGPGRNYTVPVMRSGNAIYLKILATNPWAMESIRVSLRGLGPVLRRGA